MKNKSAESWKPQKLIATIQYKPQYGYTASATSEDTGIKFLRITDIQNNRVNWDNVPYCQVERDVNKYTLRKDDIVFVRTGATTGKTYLIKDDVPKKAIFASYLIRINPKDDVCPFFLNLYFKSKFYWNQVQTRGGTKPNFNAQKLQNITVPLPFKNNAPDLKEQKRIADKVNKLFVEIDKAIEKTNTVITNADNLFWSSLNRLINKGLSNGWHEISLVELSSFFNDGDWVEKRHQSTNGIRLLQTGNVGVIDFRDKDGKKYISEETFNLLRCKDVLSGDILISRLPEPVGRACIVPKLDGRLITAVDCTIVRLEKGYVTEFINYLLNSRYSIDQVHSYLSGSSRKRISRKNLEEIKLPVPMLNGKPDTDKQEKIARELTKVRELSLAAKEKYQKQLSLLEMLKQSLLNQAFQGKL